MNGVHTLLLSPPSQFSPISKVCAELLIKNSWHLGMRSYCRIRQRLGKFSSFNHTCSSVNIRLSHWVQKVGSLVCIVSTWLTFIGSWYKTMRYISKRFPVASGEEWVVIGFFSNFQEVKKERNWSTSPFNFVGLLR